MIGKIHGHMTMADGSRVPLSEDQAASLWKMAEDAKARRAEDMPTAQDALRALIRAHERMRDLGWRLGGGLRVKRGEECAVAETGSTGIWRGRLDREGLYVQYGDSVSSPRKCWLKPLLDLTDDERVWMEECDRRGAEAYSAMIDRLATGEQQ